MNRFIYILRPLVSTTQFFRAVTSFFYALIFFLLVFSGKIYRYVHERHIPILLISAAVLCIIGILYLYDAVSTVQKHYAQGRSHQKTPHITTLAFLLPIAALLFSESPLDFSVIAYNNPFSSGTYTGTGASSNTELTVKNDCIIVNDENFTAWLAELYTNLAAWEGKKIRVSGAIWKDGELFAQDEFALARMMMICCAADMQPIGILARWSETAQLQEGAWVLVQGTIGKKAYQDTDEPMIVCTDIAVVPRPAREYVYP